ncbi:hypothetical protein STCU_11638 [Strigomonas culicis]|uniref:Secreted protein n=1 Tax=Strigomonas culicis TaxID=28005 RepID=S9THZ9_9TRYP|nr:hypothetical protein STCU_11638 [Strigomonas culicis]|eukprot:EPY15968.1 hypothetical protein STCU_11638 [Strigomonas culicis]
MCFAVHFFSLTFLFFYKALQIAFFFSCSRNSEKNKEETHTKVLFVIVEKDDAFRFDVGGGGVSVVAARDDGHRIGGPEAFLLQVRDQAAAERNAPTGLHS